MIWYIYALLMALIFILLWFAYEHNLVYMKVLGYGFLFIVNFPLFVGSFYGEGIEFIVGTNSTVSGSTTIETPIYDYYTNYWIFSFLSLIGVYGATLLTFDEIKFRMEKQENES